MNFRNMLKALEKLIVEVLSWLVLIPRTLRRILEHPDDVDAFVQTELAKGESEELRARFKITSLLDEIGSGLKAAVRAPTLATAAE